MKISHSNNMDLWFLNKYITPSIPIDYEQNPMTFCGYIIKLNPHHTFPFLKAVCFFFSLSFFFFFAAPVYTAYPLSHWHDWEPQQMVPSDIILTGFLCKQKIKKATAMIYWYLKLKTDKTQTAFFLLFELFIL